MLESISRKIVLFMVLVATSLTQVWATDDLSPQAFNTHNKIIKLSSPNDFSPDDASALLHNLYFKDNWGFYILDESRLEFQDQKNISKMVNAFKFEGRNFQFLQNNDTTYLALPTDQNDHYFIIRYNKNDVKSLSMAEIDTLLSSQKTYIRSVIIPSVLMKAVHDPKTLSKFDLPNVLTKNFLINEDQDAQNFTLGINGQGIEISPFIEMRSKPERGCRYKSGPEIIIDRPFSCAVIRKSGNKYLWLLSEQIVDHSVMKIIQQINNS